ncbi:MAG: glycosyltransferase family 2 protein, partial [Candidatus Omnitrophica bacterium]|nr:glycosyltransferase family 2 protein [Candidatus Omnitrophota bacterium]
MGRPLVSIVIPTKNRRSLLEETLASVRNQSYLDWEAIVVDDQSTDDTVAYMGDACAEDPRIRLLLRTGEKGNANVCRNQGFQASKGEFVIFLDSDDLLAPDCLENRVAAMESRPELDFIVSLGELFESTPGDTGLLWNIFTLDSDLTRFLTGRDSPWQTSGPIWRRRVLDEVDWDEDLRSWQDGDFHVRVLARHYPYGRVNAPDYFIRRGVQDPSSISKVDKTSDHLMDHAESYAKLARELKTRNLFDKKTRNTLASVFYIKCKGLVENGHISSALSVWNRCYSVGCCGMFRLLEGLLLFGLCRISPLRQPIGRLLAFRWKNYHILQASGTGRKIYKSNMAIQKKK